MNAPNYKPTFEELSLYYDGLLDPQRQQQVEAWLNDQSDPEPMMSIMEGFDQVLEPQLSEQDIDQLLSNNVQEIHNRIFESERRTESGWLFFLQPKFLAAALGIFLLIGVGVTMMQEGSSVNTGPVIVDNQPDITQPDDSQTPDQDSTPVANDPTAALQEQMILAAADYAKSAFNSGYGYASEKSKNLAKNIETLNQSESRPLALDAVRMTLSQSQASDDNPDESTAAETLTKMGQRQVALGVGATMLTMINVF